MKPIVIKRFPPVPDGHPMFKVLPDGRAICMASNINGSVSDYEHAELSSVPALRWVIQFAAVAAMGWHYSTARQSSHWFTEWIKLHDRCLRALKAMEKPRP